jgi:hypothetical protein
VSTNGRFFFLLDSHALKHHDHQLYVRPLAVHQLSVTGGAMAMGGGWSVSAPVSLIRMERIRGRSTICTRFSLPVGVLGHLTP